MPKISIEGDTEHLKAKFATHKLWFQKGLKAGLEVAMVQFMDDCINTVPRCPQKTGAMAASHSVFVGSKLVATSEGMVTVVNSSRRKEKRVPTPATTVPGGAGGWMLTGTLVVNKPYAVPVHEGIAGRYPAKNYTLPGSGPKWVSSKLIAYGDKYLKLMASAVRKMK